MITITLLIISAYILGSVPTSIWIGKIFYGIDIREHGSGNAGTTNTIRILGAKAGIPVFIIDVVKAYVATALVYLNTQIEFQSESFFLLQIVLGIVAVAGHIFPVFARFKGGKGVASLFGMALCLDLTTALTSLGIFVILLIITRYVSFSALLAATVYPFQIIFIFDHSSLSVRIFSVVICFVLLYTHRENIKRLIEKKENKFSFSKKQIKTSGNGKEN